MAERIDHVAAALAARQSAYQTSDVVNRANRLAEAQVHAALALVEQQRLANLIALAEHAQRRYGNYAGEAGGVGTLLSYGETEGSNMRIREDVREVLGL